MEIGILKSSKDEIEMHVENLTMVELLRVYLNKDPSVNFVAWKREHPSEKAILNVRVKGKTAKKAINDAIAAIIKDLDQIDKDFSAMK